MEILYIAAAALLTLPITTFDIYKKTNLPGLTLCILLAIPSWLLGNNFPLVGGPVIAIVSGMVLASIWEINEYFISGIKCVAKRILQVAIVLFGFQMNLNLILSLSSNSVILVISTFFTALLVAFLLGPVIGTNNNERLLIGVGTSICGGSAIAATAPIIKANNNEVAASISTIFLFNVLALFTFPLIGNMLQMSDFRFGLWAGSAINDTSSVLAASFAYSNSAGQTATVVKLMRTLLIIPTTLILAVFQSKKEQNKIASFSIYNNFPWFVIAFLAASIINTLNIIPPEIKLFWSQAGKYCIVTAMVAIGLNTNVKELFLSGKKPVLLGLCCSLAIILFSLLLQGMLGII